MDLSSCEQAGAARDRVRRPAPLQWLREEDVCVVTLFDGQPRRW